MEGVWGHGRALYVWGRAGLVCVLVGLELSSKMCPRERALFSHRGRASASLCLFSFNYSLIYN